MTLYEHSCNKATKAFMRGSTEKIPLWVPNLLKRLPTRIPASQPVEVACVTRIHVSREFSQARLKVAVVLLLYRGWSLDMSMSAFKNFRMLYPQQRFEFDMHSVLTREQLRDEYGPTYGNLFADINVDPDSQPYVHALMHGSLLAVRWRPMAEALLLSDMSDDLVNTMNANMPLESLIDNALMYRMSHGGEFRADAVPLTLPRSEAINLYTEATGQAPQLAYSLSPLEYDYEELAAKGLPRWEAVDKK